MNHMIIMFKYHAVVAFGGPWTVSWGWVLSVALWWPRAECGSPGLERNCLGTRGAEHCPSTFLHLLLSLSSKYTLNKIVVWRRTDRPRTRTSPDGTTYALCLSDKVGESFIRKRNRPRTRSPELSLHYHFTCIWCIVFSHVSLLSSCMPLIGSC